MRIVNPIGKKGEDIAVAYLKKKGYKILERNYRKQYAEIDIIAIESVQQVHDKQVWNKQKKEQVLVFVEVKTRTTNTYGTPFEAITKWKLRPMIKLAEYFKISHTHLPSAMRIDAIAVLLNAVDELEDLKHLENISGF